MVNRKVVKRINPKSSHHKEKHFLPLCFSFAFVLWEDGLTS